MAGLYLFFKARHAVLLIVALALLATVVWLLGDRRFLIGERSPIPVPLAAVIPCIAAYTIAGSALPQQAWLEGLAARPIRLFQDIYVTALSVVNGVLLWVTTGKLDDSQLGSVAALRNYAGCLGISVAAVTIAGPELGWIAPVIALFVAVFSTSYTPWLQPLTWMIQPDGHRIAFASGWSTSR